MYKVYIAPKSTDDIAPGHGGKSFIQWVSLLLLVALADNQLLGVYEPKVIQDSLYT